jgi:translation initiation factor IF-2
MRLVQLAKALGMTGQQLRKELETVNFGIKPTDREIPDNLAQGVLRFVANKHGIKVDVTALGANFMEEGMGEEGGGGGQIANESAPAAAPGLANEIQRKESEKVASRAEALHVLRKLTLDDVPREAIKRQQRQLTKEEMEERKREEKAQPATRRGAQAAPAVQQQIKKKEGKVTLPASITVKEFAEKAGVQVPRVIAALLKNGVLATITQSIDYDTAALVALDLGVTVEKEHTTAKVEDLLSKNLEELIKDEPENLQPRPPIVVVMGHVDHGKTSILDAIRSTDVVAKESGGITQHIGAYQVVYNDKPITFLDTPGHEAFTAMRARGAQVTDIAILVVSAEEGIKETTVEAINHAKEAGVPIIVAINKIDRPNAEPDRVKGELAAHGLQPEDWGGNVAMLPTSAVTKQGIPELLDHILLIAEMENLKANPKRKAIATVIESHLDTSHGPLATVIVNTGTLKVGDSFICGRTLGKVRAMSDSHGKKLADVLPSGPVRVSGFDAVPHTGDILQVMGSEREARDMHRQVSDTMGAQQKRGFADLVSRLTEGKLPQLKIVVKADTQGSLEAIQASLEKQGTDKVAVKVIHGAIGAVTESDAMMASASEALVMAFRVPVPGPVARTADREGVQIREYDVIYKLLEEVEGLLLGLLVPEEQEKIFGHLEVKGVFLTKKSEQVIGGRVLDGVIKRVTFRIKRGEEQVGTGRITSLRKVDQDIKEAKEGTECGMRTESSIPLEVGDILEAYAREFKKKE